MNIAFELNGRPVSTDARPHQRALDLLRDVFHIRSLNRRCVNGTCCRCLIILDDRPVCSCSLPSFELKGKIIVTSEGLEHDPLFAGIVRAFDSEGLSFCAECAPARALSATALLISNPSPGEEAARRAAEAVCCGCTPVHRVAAAILHAAEQRGAH